MARKFVVIDDDGGVSYNAKKEAPESFTSMAAASRRARELADLVPGKQIEIFERVALALAPIGPVSITRSDDT